MDATILLAIGARLDKLEEHARWAERYIEVLENALVFSLPPCIFGLAGPLFSEAHLAACRHCAALNELEELEDSPVPGGGNGEDLT